MSPQDVTNRPRLLRESNAIRVARRRPAPLSWFGVFVLLVAICWAISAGARYRAVDTAKAMRTHALEVAE